MQLEVPGGSFLGVWLCGVFRRLSNSTAPQFAMALASSVKRKGGGSQPSDDGHRRDSGAASSTPSLSARKLPARRLRPTRTIRRPARYTFDLLDEEAEPLGRDVEDDRPPYTKRESQQHGHEDPYSTNSEAEEDARIERSMGVIRKNAASRGTEGGTKYHCDFCSIDITSTVRVLSPSSAILRSSAPTVLIPDPL